MKLLVKHQRMQATWSPTAYTVHFAIRGQLLCNNGKPDACDDTLSPNGWRLIDDSPQRVSCKLCLAALDRCAIDSTATILPA